MKPGVEARVRASELVGRVDREGAWSNVVAREIDMPEADAALVRHLLYGTLRNRDRIDRAIAALSSRPLGAIQVDVRDVLRVAFHEVLFGRAADHAVADTAVESVRERSQPKAAGFVNALVRNLQRRGEPEPPVGLGQSYGLPEWLVRDLEASWGQGPAWEFVEQSHRDAKIGIRVRDGDRVIVAELVDTGISNAYYLESGAVPEGSVIQDPASVAVSWALGVEPGCRVLDICSAPGGKTLALWDAGPDQVVAVDNHPRRIAAARRRINPLGFEGSWIRADGRSLPFAGGNFDRVLLDAPCTGLGTLRRRPEIRFKVNESERDRLAALQKALLLAALTQVRAGGRLVYSVCTVTPAETIEVVADMDAHPPDGLPGKIWGDGLLMAPHLSSTDGMFIAVFDR